VSFDGSCGAARETSFWSRRGAPYILAPATERPASRSKERLTLHSRPFSLPLVFPPAAAGGSSSLHVKIKVEVGDSEPIESALRRFKREVNKSGHLMELRHRRYFENSQEKVKRKVREGRIRRKFERMQKRRQQSNGNGGAFRGGGGGGSSMSSPAAASAASSSSSPAAAVAP
jgi:small subunit ribosomal protein S21